jgi:hypothetical protein
VVARPILALAATTTLLAGCGGGGSPQVAPPTASSSVVSPTPIASATTPAPAPSSAAPLSAFEADPAVKALRLEYLGGAKAVNLKNGDLPELRDSSTQARFERMQALVRPEFGMHYPGPVPFTPLAVSAASAGERRVAMCILGDGWLQDPATGRPTAPRRVTRWTASVVKQGTAWKVDAVRAAPDSCAGVQIPEVLF